MDFGGASVIYVLLLGVILGQATWYVPMRLHAQRHHDRTLRAIWRFFTGYRVRFNDPVNLIVERRAKFEDKAESAIQFDRTRYPNGRFLPAMDELTGGSVIEVDVDKWQYVRALELSLYGCYWHRMDGEYVAAGITPDEEAAERNVGGGGGGEYASEPCVLTANGWWEMKMAQMDQAELSDFVTALAGRGIVS